MIISSQNTVLSIAWSNAVMKVNEENITALLYELMTESITALRWANDDSITPLLFELKVMQWWANTLSSPALHC